MKTPLFTASSKRSASKQLAECAEIAAKGGIKNKGEAALVAFFAEMAAVMAK